MVFTFLSSGTVEPLTNGFYRVTVRHGFMQEPNVPHALEACAAHGPEVDLDTDRLLAPPARISDG